MWGIRSSFRDWAAETTSYPREVCEMALAHAIENETEAAYRRGNLLIKRVRLMADWSKYCGKVMSANVNNVTSLREKALKIIRKHLLPPSKLLTLWTDDSHFVEVEKVANSECLLVSLGCPN